MTRDKKLQALRDWHERMKACDAALAEFSELTGADPESRLMLSVQHVMIIATEHTAQLVGCSPTWLEDWWSEDEFGARPMRASVDGGPLQDISTIEQLFALIFDEGDGTEDSTL
jgi:hypothetical protein